MILSSFKPKTAYPATLLCDFYKVSHKEQYPDNTQFIYSTWTPRGSRLEGVDKVVAFGIQGFIKEYLINYFNEMFFNRPTSHVLYEYKRVIKFTLGVENPDTSHIEALHKLGYLPILINAVPEGTLVPLRVPMMTIENTLEEFFWVTNYLETLISNMIWQPMTSATVAFQYRKLLDYYADKTVGNTDAVQFQGHDFSMRGMGGLDATKTSGAAHLLSFVGTDSIPAILYHEEHYNADIEKELVGTSIPATEHSVMCANGQDEIAVIDRLISKVYPNGFVSIVSDTWDFWHLVENVYPALKDKIMARDGRVVIRPDSGDPVEIICGVDIINLTNNKYIKDLDDAKSCMKNILVEKVRYETPHGECGEHTVDGIFKFDGEYYRIEVDIDWNRYDKQYYFVDGSCVTSCDKFVPTAEQLGLIESLWNTFGGTITEKGYKLLDSHIGAIYGDSITIERTKEICRRLEEKGFASTNIVLGIGSFTYQYNTRDTFYFAMKATHAIVDSEERNLFKDPKTDNGMKRSQRGRVVVIEHEDGIIYKDGLSINDQSDYYTVDILEPVFIDGKLIRDESLSEIRQRLLSNL